jgi:membrane peptidoglycan carboxypeptidase
MGVRGPNVYIPAVCAITLGSVSVNPLAMTAGYATLANGGIRCEPFAIARVVDRDGKTIFRARPSCQRAVRAQIAAQVTAMLRRVVETGGTGWRANIGRPQAGKTGTGQDYKDAWFMGYVPQMATGVWVGYANREYAMRGLRVLGGGNAFGGTIAAPIWHDYMVKAVRGMPVRDFPKPPPEKRGTVPNVVGLRQRQAVSVLTEADFTPIVRMVDSLEPRGVVVAQSPAGGTSAPLGIGVTIDVSTGVAPRTRVPRVVGLRLAEARDRLLRAGFAVEVVEVAVEDPGQDGIVLGQDPRGGSTRPQGTTVTVRVGRLEAEPSPSP